MANKDETSELRRTGAPGLIMQEDLMRWLGWEQPARIERFLLKHGIPYFHGKGGRLCTTQAAIDSRLVKEVPRRPEIEFTF